MTARSPVASSYPLLVLALAGCLGLLAGVNPTLALAGAGAIAFIAVLVASFPLATGMFVVVTFINLPDSAAKAIGVLLVIALVARIASGRERDLSFGSAHPGATAMLALFLAWSLLGLLWADSGSAVSAAVLRYVLNFAVLFVIYAAARTKRDVLLLVMMFVLGCAIAGAYTLIHPAPAGPFDDVSRSGGTLGAPMSWRPCSWSDCSPARLWRSYGRYQDRFASARSSPGSCAWQGSRSACPVAGCSRSGSRSSSACSWPVDGASTWQL